MRGLISNIRFLVNYTFALRRFLRDTLTFEDGLKLFEKQFQERERTFLDILETAVYARPSHPYHKLFASAGIEFQDVRNMVGEFGLEGTLERLYDRGVYLTPAEYKGRKAVSRNGITFKTTAEDFDSPFYSEKNRFMPIRSSGSTGPASELKVDFNNLYERATLMLLAPVARLARPRALWWPGDLMRPLFYPKINLSLEKNFSMARFPWLSKMNFFVNYTTFVCRLLGRRVVQPEYVPLNEADKVARWLAAKTAQGTPAILRGLTGSVVRVCLAAR